MNVNIDQIEGTMQFTDGADLEDPEIVESIVRIVLSRVHNEQMRVARMEHERGLWPGVTRDPGSTMA